MGKRFALIAFAAAVAGFVGAFLAWPQKADAACNYKGQKFPEGTVIEGRVCKDGKWQ